MKIKCSLCKKPVSNVDLPEDTIIRAWIECPECIDRISKMSQEEKNKEYCQVLNPHSKIIE